MSELLAPVGNIEALKAAISNGCDAIYLSTNRFGARAYAQNFTIDSLREAVSYAHLRNVLVYVTMNTIVFDEELEDAYQQIDKLYLMGIDGIIVQDIALIEYIVKNYPLMEAHASTQMGIDDLDGVNFLESIGVKRAVLGRETSIDTIKYIKSKSKMKIEIFVHGALCVSYSGNCLMSGLIGYRSGNRGRCVGSCRKPYELFDSTNDISYGTSYILSMKDLNTTNHIKDLLIADSLKIEGRMKEPIYVANIIKSYRQLLDDPFSDVMQINKNLSKTFNRTFTKGYLFHEDKTNIVNPNKPNHHGYFIGTIIKKSGKRYYIKLTDVLNQNDQIRIESTEEVNYPVIKMYDEKLNLINSSSDICILEIKENVTIGDKVYKTRDVKFNEELEKTYPNEFKRIPIQFYVNGGIGERLVISVSYDTYFESISSDFILEESTKNPANYEATLKQLDRLKDTPYYIESLAFDIIDNVFIPTSKLNEMRRQLIENLNASRLAPRQIPMNNIVESKPTFKIIKPCISVYATTQEQYEAAKKLGIKIIYFNNKISRNETKYDDSLTDILVCGYNGIHHYKNKNITSDFSLNVVNYKAVALLHKLGVQKVTLSHEMNQQQIEALIANYVNSYGGYPNLEMICYGHIHLLETKYCPLKTKNLCGKCRMNQYILKDDYSYFPILSSTDCVTTILNGKVLNLIDDIESLKHINYFRIQLTIESYEESLNIIKMFLNRLEYKDSTKYFNNETDTRGHFNKEAMSKLE